MGCLIIMDKPLFSIVVGVFNIEKYLQRCLDSIDKQVKNFEVIIIDDGSTDKSGDICDKWAMNKEYVRVYHQQNQGISKVRNNGVQYSKGEYILFIDPDDWVEDSYTKTLEQLVEKNGGSEQVDIIGLNFKIVTDSYRGLKDGNSDNSYPESAVSGERALEWLLDSQVGTYACQYAIKKNLYLKNNIQFPDMILYEDAATIYRLMYFAKKVICTNKPLYNYFQRQNSFSHTPTVPRTTEYFKLFEQMDAFFTTQNRQDLFERSKGYKLPRLFSAYLNVIRLDISAKEKQKYNKKITKLIRENAILWPTNISTLVKEILFFTHLFKPISYIHDWIEKKNDKTKYYNFNR